MGNRTQPLTDTQLRNAKPKTERYTLRDGDGLELLIQTTGVKAWYFRYQSPATGKRAVFKYAAPPYPATGLAAARAWREECRGLLAQSIDPKDHAEERKRAASEQAASTFKAVATEWHTNQLSKWKPDHAARVMRAFELHLFPSLGDRPITAISVPELLRTLKAIHAKGFADVAARMRAYCRGIFAHAQQAQLRQDNPAEALAKALPTTKTENRPALPLERVPELLERIEADKAHPVTKAMIRLTMLTFVRSSEMRFARWSEIDFARAEWLIPGERVPLAGVKHSERGAKMKTPHLVPLSSQALEIFEQLHAATGNGEVIFRLDHNPAPVSENTTNLALRRMGYDTKTEVCGHGFRTIACSSLIESGLWSVDAVERQMGHQERNNVRAAYTHKAEFIQERRLMTQWWADYLDAIRPGYITPHDFANPQEQGENVTTMERKR